MQILIEDFRCNYSNSFSNGNSFNNIGRCILEINNNFLIIKSNCKSNRRELYKISFSGWHNISIYENQATKDYHKHISIETDILVIEYNEYKLKHLELSFIPLQTHHLDKIFSYLNNINNHNLSKSELKILQDIKIRKYFEEESLRAIESKKFNLNIKKFISSIKLFIKNINLNMESFIITFNSVNEDKEINNILTNFFKKYIGKKFLYKEHYILIANHLLKNNYIYHISKKVPNKIFKMNDYEYYNKIFKMEDYDYYKLFRLGNNYFNNYEIDELTYIDKIVDFLQENYSILNRDYAKLIIWIKLCEVATTYYSNLFYKLYGKQVGNIESLDISECIYKYISLDIINNSQELKNMFVYFLISNNKYINYNNHYLTCKELFNNIYNKIEEKFKYDSFISSISTNEDNKEEVYTINDIDLMTGNEFEGFISELFNKMGYKTIVTKASGDQGIDVVAEKNGVRIGIQTKCYSSNVSNSAIQEVVAGMSYYKCNKGIVITNNYFTNAAIELAKVNDVILWDREILKQKILELF